MTEPNKSKNSFPKKQAESKDSIVPDLVGISLETISLTKKLKLTLKLALCEASFICPGCGTPDHHIELEKVLALIDVAIENDLQPSVNGNQNQNNILVKKNESDT